MNYQIKQAFTPFGKVTATTLQIILGTELALLLLVWSVSQFVFLPNPMEIIRAYPELFRRGLVGELMTSLTLCLKSILIATVVAAFVSYLSRLPVFLFVGKFVTKGRFLSSVGLSFFFTMLTSSGNGLKTGILVFFITVVFVTSFMAVIDNIKEYKYNHARTLGLGPWHTLWEVVIKGTLADMIEIMKQNFAIAWMLLTMVEGIVRSEGGIGVMLLIENRVLRLDNIFALQIVVLIVGICLDALISYIKDIICPYAKLSVINK